MKRKKMEADTRLATLKLQLMQTETVKLKLENQQAEERHDRIHNQLGAMDTQEVGQRLSLVGEQSNQYATIVDSHHALFSRVRHQEKQNRGFRLQREQDKSELMRLQCRKDALIGDLNIKIVEYGNRRGKLFENHEELNVKIQALNAAINTLNYPGNMNFRQKLIVSQERNNEHTVGELCGRALVLVEELSSINVMPVEGVAVYQGSAATALSRKHVSQ